MMQEKNMREEISGRACTVFQVDMQTMPRMTLRGGYAVDSYEEAPAFDVGLDGLSDEYLEAYTFWGLTFLDAESWRYYLPRLIDYAFRHPDDPAMVVEGLLHNLRPPDREPPRLASLNAEQEAVIAAFLQDLAFSEDMANREFALQVLEEWWIPDALYRPVNKGGEAV